MGGWSYLFVIFKMYFDTLNIKKKDVQRFVSEATKLSS